MKMLFTYINQYFWSFIIYGILAIIIAAVSCQSEKNHSVRRNNDAGRSMVIYVFAVYIAGLLAVTILPRIEFFYSSSQFIGIEPPVRHTGSETVNLIPFREIYRDITGNAGDSVLNLAGNILMFLPFGFLLPVVCRKRDFIVILIPLASSVGIEAVQLLEGRHCDIDDIFLNTVGAIIGWTLRRIMFPASEIRHGRRQSTERHRC